MLLSVTSPRAQSPAKVCFSPPATIQAGHQLGLPAGRAALAAVYMGRSRKRPQSPGDTLGPEPVREVTRHCEATSESSPQTRGCLVRRPQSGLPLACRGRGAGLGHGMDQGGLGWTV